MNHADLRQRIIEVALQLNIRTNNRGTAGNVSARVDDGFLVTPSGMPYDTIEPQDIVEMHFSDDPAGEWSGQRKPSSEWRFHHDILRNRPEFHAVVHTHSTFATTLACLGLGVPAFHYMVAVAGGHDIRCAEYATFGTQELSDNALKAMQDRKAVLLANHGLIVAERSLDKALALTIEVEGLCEQYWRCLQLGRPNILPGEEMERVLQKFNKGYGQGNPPK